MRIAYLCKIINEKPDIKILLYTQYIIYKIKFSTY